MAMENSDTVNEVDMKVEEDGGLQIHKIEDTNSDHDHMQVDELSASSIGIGTVSVTNSENVHFGNNIIYNGPVIFKIMNGKEGIDNAAYTKTDDDVDTQAIPNNKQTHEQTTFCLYIKSIKKTTWFQWSLLTVCVVIIAGISVLLPPHERSINDYIDYTSNNSKIIQCLVVDISYFQLIFFFILVAVLLLLLALTKEFWLKKKEVIEISDPHPVAPVCEANDSLLIAPEHLRIVPRSDWLAQPENGELDALKLPAPWVIIAHTATEGCNTQQDCVYRVRVIQDYHIGSRKWNDIGYNFLVGGDGSAYYGRGWDYAGAHTKGYNKYSIGIAFIGTFTRQEPPQRQLDACVKLIELGVAEGKIAKDYKLLVHRQLMSTESPGSKLVDIIKNWPHFVKTNNIEEVLPNY